MKVDEVLTEKFKVFAKDLGKYLATQDNKSFSVNAQLTTNFIILLKMFYQKAVIYQLVNMLKAVSDIEAVEKGLATVVKPKK